MTTNDVSSVCSASEDAPAGTGVATDALLRSSFTTGSSSVEEAIGGAAGLLDVLEETVAGLEAAPQPPAVNITPPNITTTRALTGDGTYLIPYST